MKSGAVVVVSHFCTGGIPTHTSVVSFYSQIGCSLPCSECVVCNNILHVLPQAGCITQSTSILAGTHGTPSPLAVPAGLHGLPAPAATFPLHPGMLSSYQNTVIHTPLYSCTFSPYVQRSSGGGYQSTLNHASGRNYHKAYNNRSVRV